MQFGSCNEIFWCDEYTHILNVGQLALFPSASLLGCKFFHAPPFLSLIVMDKYVVHRLQSILRMTIHLHGVHKHLVANGKCKETMDEIKRLIIEDVNRTHDAKIFAIFMNVNNTFLVKLLLDDNGNGIMELLDGEKLEQIQD